MNIPVPPATIITERRALTGLGLVFAALVVLSWVFAILLYTSLIGSQLEIICLLVGIAGTLTFGLGAAHNVSRTYEVRSDDRILP